MVEVHGDLLSCVLGDHIPCGLGACARAGEEVGVRVRPDTKRAHSGNSLNEADERLADAPGRLNGEPLQKSRQHIGVYI